MSHFPRALLGRAARPAWACSLHLLTAPKKQPQLQRKQMGGWNLFSTHLIKRQGRSWMHWPLISHLFLCLTERQSLSKGLEKSFHHKKKVAQKWWREIKHPNFFLLENQSHSWKGLEETFPPAGSMLPPIPSPVQHFPRIVAEWDFSSPILIAAGDS